jgi:hypothetical protein
LQKDDLNYEEFGHIFLRVTFMTKKYLGIWIFPLVRIKSIGVLPNTLVGFKIFCIRRILALLRLLIGNSLWKERKEEKNKKKIDVNYR